jgi:hypothetical protein
MRNLGKTLWLWILFWNNLIVQFNGILGASLFCFFGRGLSSTWSRVFNYFLSPKWEDNDHWIKWMIIVFEKNGLSGFCLKASSLWLDWTSEIFAKSCRKLAFLIQMKLVWVLDQFEKTSDDWSVLNYFCFVKNNILVWFQFWSKILKDI